jgi:hypothetical protein
MFNQSFPPASRTCRVSVSRAWYFSRRDKVAIRVVRARAAAYVSRMKKFPPGRKAISRGFNSMVTGGFAPDLSATLDLSLDRHRVVCPMQSGQPERRVQPERPGKTA